MSDRKETPDILGSVLGGPPAKPTRSPDIIPDPEGKKAPTRRAGSQRRPTAKPKPQATAKAGARPATKKTAPVKKPVPAVPVTAWEYREVMFYDYGGYVVRSVDGKDLSDWKRRKIRMSDYINRMGGKGWEMVGLTNPRRYYILTVFKRPKT